MNKKIAGIFGFIAITTAIASAAVPAYSGSPDLDQGVDMQKLVDDIKTSDGVTDKSLKIGPINPIQYTRGCSEFTFGPYDPLVSQPVWLTSQEYREICHYDPWSGAGNCYIEYGRIWRQKVQISINERKLLPWEREVFTLCQEGPYTDIYKDAPAYKYSEKSAGADPLVFTLTPVEKIPTAPDPGGIALETIGYDASAGNIKIRIKDVWFDYYQGEQTLIHAVLMLRKNNWFDQTVAEKDIAFSAGRNYMINFADFAGSLSPGQYYVKWGFKRIGKISKSDYIKKADTDSVEVK